jgi:glycosyltransferase involved in cell wall biosynthesis
MVRLSMAIRYSAIIPVHNEAGNISSLDEELKSVLTSLGKPFEIIYVNDGSTDASLTELKALKDVTILNLNRCYGQATALDAGFKAAQGAIIISLDGDGQNEPADIVKLLAKMEAEQLDVVAGWRKVRSDKKGIRVLTRIGRSLRRTLIDDPVHDTGCTLRVYTREAAQSLDIGGEMHRYILALLRWKGFTIGEVVVNDRARIHGKSKYNYSKAIRGFIDLIYIWFIYKYSQRPLHLFGYVSMMAFVLGVLSLMWTIYGKLFLDTSLNRNGWFFLAFFFLLAAIILFSFGILIDLVLRIYLNTSVSEKRYYVRQVIKT